MMGHRTVATVLMMVLVAGVSYADFPHAWFNTNKVAEVVFCKGDWVKTTGKIKKDDQEKSVKISEAVPLGVAVKQEAAVDKFHELVKAPRCYTPHVRPRGKSFAILAYVDKAGKPLALIQLWADGKYYIYEGYTEKTGKFFKGHAKGNHGGCSCGLSPDLGKAVARFLEKRLPKEEGAGQ